MLAKALTVCSTAFTLPSTMTPIVFGLILLGILLTIRLVSRKFIKHKLFDFRQARQGKQSKLVICLALIISILSIFYIDYFPLKLVLFGSFFANFIVALYGNLRRNIWRRRINKALKTQLGSTLKSVLPANCRCYSINNLRGSSMAIYFKVDGELRVLSFESLGYEDLPGIYTDIICQWIQENIVYNKDNYEIQEIMIETESWEGGSPDYIKATVTSTGFESHRVSRDSGYLKIKKTTHGYKLVHKDHTTKEKTQSLNKWK